MSPEPLDAWLYGTRVAQLRETSRGRMLLEWTQEARDRWGPGARVLSAKLDMGTPPPPPLVRVYLDGLLPEGNARVNHAITAGVPPDDTFALIRAYGRDTPGAAIFVPEGDPDPTRTGRYEELSTREVAQRLLRADAHAPATPGETTESSTLPGMVPKITLHRQGDQWLACKEGAPSTWILKRGGASGSIGGDIIDTEVACLSMAKTLGLTTIDAEVVDFGVVRAIAVSRYDRAAGAVRVHQEDLAQAIGLNTSDPNRKFQWGAQMPSLAGASDVLRLDGGNPDDLLRLVTFSFLVGNTDMHAKNISFLRYPDLRVDLSPAYDIAMHLHHDREDRRTALDINGKFRVDDLTIEDVVAEGRAWGMTVGRAERIVAGTARDLVSTLAGLDRGKHPGVTSAAWDVVEERTIRAVDALKGRGLARKRVPKPRAIEASARKRGPRRPG